MRRRIREVLDAGIKKFAGCGDGRPRPWRLRCPSHLRMRSGEEPVFGEPSGEVGAKRPSTHAGGLQRKLHRLRMGPGLLRGDSRWVLSGHATSPTSWRKSTPLETSKACRLLPDSRQVVGAWPSRSSLFEDQLLERQIRRRLAETVALFLKLLETIHLIAFQAAAFIAPTVILELCHADRTNRFANRSSLQNIDLAKFGDDLFGLVLLLGHSNVLCKAQ